MKSIYKDAKMTLRDGWKESKDGSHTIKTLTIN